MITTKKADQTDLTFEYEDLLWESKPDATSTATEFLAARTLFLELSHDSLWNPWILENRVDEYQQAMGVMAQWTRAEPGHRPMTKRPLDAQVVKWDREFEVRRMFETYVREEADEFWDSLGWCRYEHPDGTVHYRPLLHPAGLIVMRLSAPQTQGVGLIFCVSRLTSCR